jgi:hypothetical protein
MNLEMNKYTRAILGTFIAALITLTLMPKPAVYAAGPSFSFNTSNFQAIQSCTGRLQVIIDTAGQTSNAADIILKYDPTKIEIKDAKPTTAGIQIYTGTAYDVYAGNIVDTTNGTIKLTGFNSNLNGKAVFAELEFNPKAASGSTQIAIEFQGASQLNSKDSNIADATTSNDILSSVQNVNISFTSGPCDGDTTAPAISFVSPQHLQQNIPANAQIKFTVSDSGSGVNIQTLQIALNGVQYTASSPGVTITGSSASYEITIIPSQPIPQDTASSMYVNVKDFNGNTREATIVFNVPPDQEILITPMPFNCPVIPPTLQQCSAVIQQSVTSPQKGNNALFPNLYDPGLTSAISSASAGVLGAILLPVLGLSILPLLTGIFRFIIPASGAGKSVVKLINTVTNKHVSHLRVALISQTGKLLEKTFSDVNGIVKTKVTEPFVIKSYDKAYTTLETPTIYPATTTDTQPVKLAKIGFRLEMPENIRKVVVAIVTVTAFVLAGANIYLFGSTGNVVPLGIAVTSSVVGALGIIGLVLGKNR